MARKIFPNDTPSATVAPDDRVLFSDTSDSGAVNDASVQELVEAGLSGVTTDDVPEGATNRYFSDELVSANPDVLANTNARHSHENKELLDTYNVPGAQIDDANEKKHTHANQSALDAITASGYGNLYLADDGTYKSFGWGAAGSAGSLSLTGVTLVAGLNPGDPVYWNSANNRWEKSTGLNNLPVGVLKTVSPSEVVVSGLCEIPGFFLSGMTYYYSDSLGALTFNANPSGSVKVGVAISADVLIVDIDAESGLYTPHAIVWVEAGYSVGWASAPTRITRIRLDTETVADLVPTTVTSVSAKLNNGWNSAYAGYYGVGTAKVVNKHTFATETSASIAAALTSLLTTSTTSISGPNHMYITNQLYWNKLNFSNESISATWNFAAAWNVWFSSFSSSIEGFRGWNGTTAANIEKIVFSTGAISSTWVSLANSAGSTNSPSTGYQFGGYTSVLTSALAVNLSTYAVSSLPAIPIGISYGGCVTSNAAGYMLPSNQNYVQKMNYSTGAYSTGNVYPSGGTGNSGGSFQSGGYL